MKKKILILFTIIILSALIIIFGIKIYSYLRVKYAKVEVVLTSLEMFYTSNDSLFLTTSSKLILS